MLQVQLKWDLTFKWLVELALFGPGKPIEWVHSNKHRAFVHAIGIVANHLQSSSELSKASSGVPL